LTRNFIFINLDKKTMKRIYTLLFASALSTLSFSQGMIQGFTIDPPSPTTTDVVKVYVDVMFPTMGCAVDNQGHSTTGSSTTGFAHHCLGMLSAICTTVDTFNLGTLSAGTHTFSLTLTSGLGGPPCTPGFAPDDNESTSFVVSTPVGITEYDVNASSVVFPNPMNGKATIRVAEFIQLKNAECKVTDVMGKNVKTIHSIHTNEFLIERDKLSEGIYFYQIMQHGTLISKGKLVIE